MPIKLGSDVASKSADIQNEGSEADLFKKEVRRDPDKSRDRDESTIDKTTTTSAAATTNSRNQLNEKLDPKNFRSNQTAKTPTTSKPAISRFLAIHLHGSIETGFFRSVNDVYIKYTLVSGPDWILSSGSDVGISQISRFNSSYSSPDGSRKFVWNQPVTASYRSYNFYGWPQLVLSVYYFDFFGNDQILGYGSTHLPISSQLPANFEQQVEIFAPQSTSMMKQILSWLTGRRPELVNSALFARADCRRVLQVVKVGHIKLRFNLTSKDISSNGYRS